MKTEPSLKLAIMRNLTAEQQNELEGLITALALSATKYGQAMHENDAAVNEKISAANNAWSALRAVGLNVQY